MIKWFDREFDFANNPHDLASLKKRLSEFPSKLEKQVINIPERVLLLFEPGKWSIKEHIGHLADLEPLWQGRMQDILNSEKELQVTDLQNTQTHTAGHNHKSLGELLLRFREVRQQTIRQMEEIATDDLFRSALHPRLKIPMRLTDHLWFVAEHDEHHLITILNFIS